MNLIPNTIQTVPALAIPSNIAEVRPLADLLAFLQSGDAPRGQFASLFYECDAKARVPFKALRKQVTISVTLGFDYQNTVNGRLTREEMEAEFIAQPRQWGKRVNSFLVNHKDSFYLTYSGNTVLGGPDYFLDGNPIAKETIEAYLPTTRESAQGGQSQKVIYRDLAWDNLLQVSAFGKVWRG